MKWHEGMDMLTIHDWLEGLLEHCYPDWPMAGLMQATPASPLISKYRSLKCSLS